MGLYMDDLVLFFADFYIYAFLGWCFECVYVSVREREPVNRGFMRGPFLPIYGCGAMSLLMMTAPFRANPFLAFIVGVVGATLLEMITGVVMERLFKVRYWDYSEEKWNYKGYISLMSSLAWGGLTLLLVYGLHSRIQSFLLSVDGEVLKNTVLMMTIVFIFDLVCSVIAALDLARAIVRFEKTREEVLELLWRLRRISRSLTRSTQSTFYLLREEIEERMAQLAADYPFPAEYKEFLHIFSGIRKKLPSRAGLLAFFRRGLLRGNPGATSRFREALRELRELELGSRIKQRGKKGRGPSSRDGRDQ